MNEVQRLRQELKQRRVAVSNKINRIARNTGAKVAGSEFDPRRRAGIEKNYNKAQLQRHLAELNQFMHRGNQFVGGDGGSPIRRSTWNVTARRNQEVVSAAKAHMDAMTNIPAPLMGQVNPGERGQTIGESRAMMSTRGQATVKGPYSMELLSPGQVAGERAAQILSNNFLKQLKSNYLPAKIGEGRDNLKKALNIMGEESLVDKVDDLSDDAFDVLWFGSAFAEITFMKYDIEQARAAGTSKEKWQDKMVDNAFDDIGTFLQWASDLDGGTQAKGKTAKPKRKK